MYVKSALLASVAFLGRIRSQTCYVCTNSQPLTGITADDGDCYFTSVTAQNIADGIGSSSEAACAGSCFVKYVSKDGVIQSVDRGCLDAGVASATPLGVDLGTQGPDLQAKGCAAKVVDLGGSTVQFNANQDVNDLTEVTCASTCTSVAGQDGCNSAAYDVSTLSDCSSSKGGHGLCGEAGVCNHWTGDCAFSCAADTQRPVLTAGVFACTAYDCGDCTADAAGDTGMVQAKCTGTGVVGSSGACVCNEVNGITPVYSSSAKTCTNPCDSVDCSLDAAGTASQVAASCSIVDNAAECKCNTPTEVYSTSAKTCTAPHRMCIQCSSDIDSGSTCASGTMAATECPNSDDRCTAVATFWVNADGNSVREVIERGCSEKAEGEVLDTCEFNTISTLTPAADQTSMISAASTEVSCRYNCETDGCNNETPDGVDARYVATSTCHVGSVCNSLTDCASVTDFQTDVLDAGVADSASCTGDEKCKSTMKYLHHVRYDGTVERALIHLSFECTADTTEVNECSDASIGTNYVNDEDPSIPFASPAQTNTATAARQNTHMYTCTTVCTGNDCNNNWPGQPMCHTCSSADKDGSGVLQSSTNPDHCYTDVAAPAACPFYYQNACFVQQSGLDLSSNWAQKSQNMYSAMQTMGAYRSISRGCEESSTEGTVDGASVTRDSTQAQTAYTDSKHTCFTTGCNFGPALPTPNN